MEPETIEPMTLQPLDNKWHVYQGGRSLAAFKRRCDADLFMAAGDMRRLCENALAALDRKDLICHAEWRNRFYAVVKKANNPDDPPNPLPAFPSVHWGGDEFCYLGDGRIDTTRTGL